MSYRTRTLRCLAALMAALVLILHAAAADVVPSLIVTETLARSIGKQGKGRNATFFQAGSWRTNFTVVLPFNEGETLEDLGNEDGISIAIGDYSFEATFEEAQVDLKKRKAVFKLAGEEDDDLAPAGTVTVTWNADSVKIVGAIKAADPDAALVYAEGNAERGKIKDVMGATVTISPAFDSDVPRAEKEWANIKVTGTENFREVNKADDTFLVGNHQITGTSDDVRPTVTISSPRANVRQTEAAELTFAGTARDNVEVASVLVQVDDEEAEEASFESGNKVNAGTWTFDVPELEPGPHFVQVWALDHDGLLSKPVSRLITVVKTTPLTVTTEGDGKVVLSKINPLNGKKEAVKGFAAGQPVSLEAGQTYVLDATPTSAGQVFGSWSGDVEGAESAGPSFTFELPDLDEVNLTATFVVNPYPDFAGNYVFQFGLGDDAVSLDSIGQVELSINAEKGAITGKIFLGTSSAAVPFTGRLDADGSFTTEVELPGKRLTLALELLIDLESGGEVSGSVSAYRDNPEEPEFGGQLVGGRRGAGVAVPAALVGTYNVLMETLDVEDARGVVLPPGYFTAKVSATGSVNLAGVLPTGAPFTFGGELGQSGSFLVRVPVPNGLITGAIVLVQDELTGPAVETILYWNQESTDPDTGEVIFEQVEVGAVGEKVVPASSLPALFADSEGDGNIEITVYGTDENGDVTEDTIERDFTLGSTNDVTLDGEPSAEKVTMQINPADGKVTGSFQHPVTGHVVTFNGLAIPGALRAAGQYRDGADSGPVMIELFPAVVAPAVAPEAVAVVQ